MKPENKKIVEFYFSKAIDYESSHNWVCRCGVSRKSQPKCGFSNLVSHVFKEHLDWETEISHSVNSKVSFFVNKKASDIFAWIEWVIECNLPLSFCDRPLTKKYSSLMSISSQTLVKYMEKLTLHLENKLVSLLTPKFGLCIDSWSSNSTHFTAIFALCPTTNKSKNYTRFLLAFFQWKMKRILQQRST